MIGLFLVLIVIVIAVNLVLRCITRDVDDE